MSTERRFESNPSGTPTIPDWPLTNQVPMTAVAAEIAANRAGRGKVTIKNLDATNNLYVGRENVTSSTGFELGPGEGITLETRNAVWGVCAAGQTATAGFLEDSP